MGLVQSFVFESIPTETPVLFEMRCGEEGTCRSLQMRATTITL